ncbi:hypothetical protein CDAR_208291 [Caerostris darwini]|uniref:Uncharacterized protein n=1 Tax=Caerostris darwini TaxID=1538125 RepID=A0AAV4RBF5_9ARAC|nr:hypothetical protein CDAR_208291 [Caerostris darwini]
MANHSNQTSIFSTARQIPDRGTISVPTPKPRLRYHKQSYYTDTFQKPLTKTATIVPAVESRWRRPIGKTGEFYGKTTYERHYPWPTNVLKMEDYKLPPAEPTVGLGIIPILGTSPRDKMDKPSFKGAEEIPNLKIEGNYLAAQRQKNPSYWVRNCNPKKPQEKIWADETTHRLDYVLYSKEERQLMKQMAPYKDNLKFTGEIETLTSSMRDFPDLQQHICRNGERERQGATRKTEQDKMASRCRNNTNRNIGMKNLYTTRHLIQ